MNTFDVTALGELLIDFTADGALSSQGNPLFEANPGGAPCNVLAMLQKLGRRTAFIGKVGNDSFGKMLKDALKTAGINTDNLLMDDRVPTTLAFVHTAADGDQGLKCVIGKSFQIVGRQKLAAAGDLEKHDDKDQAQKGDHRADGRL